MDIIERQKKRCYICFGYGHDPDDCLLNCEKELNDLIPERHSAKLDRELEALQAKHDELAELVLFSLQVFEAYRYAKRAWDLADYTMGKQRVAAMRSGKQEALECKWEIEAALRKAVKEG